MTTSNRRTIRVYEPALCCSSGVCGSDVSQELVDFTADMAYLKDRGVDIERYNLASAPQEFASAPAVVAFLQVAGTDGLPLVAVDGVTVLTGRYPTRAELESFAGLSDVDTSSANRDFGLTAVNGGGCCGGSGCC